MRSSASTARFALLLAGTLLGGAAMAQDTNSQGERLPHVDGNAPATGTQASTGTPVETEAANVPSQEPAFANQTRAPQPAAQPEIRRETVAEGLPNGWAMEFLPDNRILFGAKGGQMMILPAVGQEGEPIEVSGVPEVASAGQGGLLDIALGPNFAEDGMIYYTFAEPRGGEGNGTSLGRAKLIMADAGARLENAEVIFQQMPTYDGDKHFGSRIVFDRDGMLFLGVGERSDTPIRDQAQDLGSGLGKVFRLNADGSVPQDNPFVGRDGAQAAIWSYGHRNIQSATLGPDGRVWTIEHGARGGDELNRPEAGKNYGWPVITYGEDYSGKPIGQGITAQEGMEQPIYYWDPVIGPSGMAIYAGDEFPEWRDAILAGGLVTQGLVVLRMDQEGRVASEERVPLDARIRDVKVGPDGAVYAMTEVRNGGGSTILRLTKAD
ncbi:glucose/arabinose dehydrogenase [Aureimonas jatrophae]|uniref:Glucose/arabinose dehydrogenase, beta-propeller fold n=2 Tax=Aureimonas jatrophae TaxID=1166073 RepID=A0A1H0D467_9HYPH|nr:PQQ-dependent sugar dehydrogenase [Aureimonas jatrophae]MBB3951700.1 glucose/arabinose dehydrogenase [Aureimonas jatrophae]SDN64957.1 Glucose/arabinose dehydrogenase, beta-propeller fold [Aureimonas jatrophae]